ncbi:unnamed protein product [Caenorhabditis sp. 36 PRJEB53466]|nr:unnamed protein product [Caenorhabditis sp. 36 PRJEB53466]
MHPAKTISGLVLFSASMILAVSALSNDDFLLKPHVLPAAEKAYHAVYHELDSKSTNGATKPVFGQIYVALIEDQFTFGGDMDSWSSKKFDRGDRGCKPLMATNVHHMCNESYFLVHQDMVKLQKTAFGGTGATPDLETVCRKEGSGFGAGPDKLIYRYNHRVLMTYKKNVDDNKCIGTYDSLTDTFTCMYNDPSKPEDHRFVPLEVQNFLWKQDDGTFARGAGNVEVFCKQMHYKE